MLVNPNFKALLLRNVRSLRDEIREYLDNEYRVAECAVDLLIYSQESTWEMSSDFLFKLDNTQSVIDDSLSKLSPIADLLKTNASLRLVRIVLLLLCPFVDFFFAIFIVIMLTERLGRVRCSPRADLLFDLLFDLPFDLLFDLLFDGERRGQQVHISRCERARFRA